MAEQPLIVASREGMEELKRRGLRPIPVPTDLTRPYWEAAKARQLRIQRCRSCGEHQHRPRPECLQCGSADIEWAPISGQGAVYSFVIDHRHMTPGFDSMYVVAQVVPIEAQRDTVRITANILECDAHDVYVGMPVEVMFQDLTEDITLPQFRPGPQAKLRSRGETPPDIRP